MHCRVTEQFSLTELRPSDRASCLEYLNDPDIHRYTCRIPYPYTSRSFDEWMEIVQGATRQYGEPINWALRDASGRLMGGIGFDNLIKGHRAEIGYWLGKPLWGQGIMSATVQAACDLARAQWKLVRITAIVFEGNWASIRVLEKNGFQREARLRKYFKRDDVFSDAFLYALIPQ